MNSGCSKVVIDQKSNLPSLQKSVVFFEQRCPPTQIVLQKNWLDKILFNADAIFASSIKKSGKSRPSVDCDVIWSSNYLATSTTLISNIGIVRHNEFGHTSVLKLTLKHWRSAECGNLPKCSSEIWSLGFSNKQFWEWCLPVRYRGFQVASCLANRGVGVVESWGSFLTPSLCSAILPVSIGFNVQEDEVKFFKFSKSAEDGSPRAGKPSKTCSGVSTEFRVSSCKQEPRQIIPLGLGILMGWLGTWDNPELLEVSGSWNVLASFKKYTYSCNSWIWTISWVTEEGFSFLCV